MPRLKLDPLSPSGVSFVTDQSTPTRQGQGYVINKVTGLITAGANVTISGQGTAESPYTIASSGSGGGGSSTWGSITGTLSSQTDLQTALNAKVSKTGDTMTGRLDFPTDTFDISNPPIRFTYPDMTTANSSKGGLLEWGGQMTASTAYAYGQTTNAYIANNAATFTVPSTGYKKWGWILAHYNSPAVTGEPVHQHLNFETVKADWSTVVTRLSISFGEDVALVSFPNSTIRYYADKLITIGNDTTNATLNYNSSTTRLEIGGTADLEIPRNVKIGAAGAAGAKLHAEATTDTVPLLVRNTTVAGNNTPNINIESQTAASRLLQGGLQSDANKRISILASGQIDWGDGTAARDTNLYRSGADTLKSDDNFVLVGKMALGQTTLDTSKVLSVVTDGTIQGIQGRASAVGTASTPVLSIETSATTKRAIDYRVTGDSVSRWRIAGTGVMEFGDGTSVDVNLYRSAADVLTTDDKFVATGGLKIGTSSTSGYVWTATDTLGNGSWQVSSGGGSGTDKMHNLTSTTVSTASTTVTANTKQGYDATAGTLTATLPASATLGDIVFIQKTDATVNVLNISGHINGTAASTLPIRTQLQGKTLQWTGATWEVIAGDLSLPALDARYVNIGGISAGTNVSITGSGTSGSPYVINASGGGSAITRSINNISTNTTAGSATSTDYVYFATLSPTLTLPTAIGNTNRYTVNNDGSGTITIATTSSQTINGSSTVTLSPNTTLELISNNTQWKVV